MNKIVIIAIIAVVLLVAIGGVVYFFVLAPGNDEPEPIVEINYSMDETYSNLSDGKILKYKMVIVYTNEEFSATLDENKIKLVNAVDEVIRTKDSETIGRPNGKERLREELKETVIEVLETDSETIFDVIFETFISQG